MENLQLCVFTHNDKNWFHKFHKSQLKFQISATIPYRFLDLQYITHWKLFTDFSTSVK